LPCQQPPLPRPLPPPLLSLLKRYANPFFAPGHWRSSDRRGVYYFQEKPKEKTIFNVKLESFDAGSKPKVIKEVKAMVPNLTLIEVWTIAVTRVLARNPDESLSFFRRRSLSSRYQRFLRRTCPRRMPRSSRRSLRVSEPSSPWSKPGSMLRLTYLHLHFPTQHPLPFKTYLPSTQSNAPIMGLGLLEAIQKVIRPRSTFPIPEGRQ